MKIVLFLEGHTEKNALAPFLKRWLDPQLPEPVGLQTVCFEGCADLIKGSLKKAKLYLSEPDVIAVIALLDLYGLPVSDDWNSTKERYEREKNRLEDKVLHDNFFNSSQFTK